jgi:F-type H+-transporting ATPase subunit delta
VRVTAADRRYARALFALASEEGRSDEVGQELDALADLLERNDELRNAIFRPLHPGAERRAALREVCDRIGSSAVVQNFCCLLVDQRRVVEFAAIRDAYAALADATAGRTRARVVSAAPLTRSQRERLQRALATRTGQSVALDVSVDPALLGGAVADVGGMIFDGSLRTQLERLRVGLTRGR